MEGPRVKVHPPDQLKKKTRRERENDLQEKGPRKRVARDNRYDDTQGVHNWSRAWLQRMQACSPSRSWLIRRLACALSTNPAHTPIDDNTLALSRLQRYKMLVLVQRSQEEKRGWYPAASLRRQRRNHRANRLKTSRAEHIARPLSSAQKKNFSRHQHDFLDRTRFAPAISLVTPPLPPHAAPTLPRYRDCRV